MVFPSLASTEQELPLPCIKIKCCMAQYHRRKGDKLEHMNIINSASKHMLLLRICLIHVIKSPAQFSTHEK